LRGQGSRPLDVTAWLLALIDTGGVHWFLIQMMANWYQGHGRSST
jgi:hypothetical protein